VVTKPKRRHHVNPRFYLRAFQIEDEEGYIWRYDSTSGEVLKLSIGDAAVQRDYYSHVNSDGLRDTEFVENFISDVEGVVAPVFQKTLTGEELNEQERMTFAFFVALSFLRAPANRRQTAELMGMFAKTIAFKNASDPRRFQTSYRQYEKHEKIEPEDQLSDCEIEELRVSTLSDEYELNVAEQVTLLPLVHIKEMAEIVFQMKWTWANAQEGIDFITGDSPVVREIDPKHQHPMEGPGFGNKSVVVSLPLSPSLCWIGTWNEAMPDKGIATKTRVKSLNRSCAIHAERYLYASTRQSGFSKLAAKYHGPGVKLVPSGFGFKGEPMDVGQFKSESKGIAAPQAARKNPRSPK
jgi:hypothetical protein